MPCAGAAGSGTSTPDRHCDATFRTSRRGPHDRVREPPPAEPSPRPVWYGFLGVATAGVPIPTAGMGRTIPASGPPVSGPRRGDPLGPGQRWPGRFHAPPASPSAFPAGVPIPTVSVRVPRHPTNGRPSPTHPPGGPLGPGRFPPRRPGLFLARTPARLIGSPAVPRPRLPAGRRPRVPFSSGELLRPFPAVPAPASRRRGQYSTARWQYGRVIAPASVCPSSARNSGVAWPAFGTISARRSRITCPQPG
jgi:hypothetical protein